MLVLEYEHKFNELSRFALELIHTKANKYRRFGNGSWDKYQVVVIANTYPSIRALAHVTESVSKKISIGSVRRCRDIFNFDGPSQGPSKEHGPSSNSSRSGLSGRCELGFENGRSRSRPSRSQNISQLLVAGMTKDSSKGIDDGYFNRGEIGHVKKDCPHHD